MTRETRIGPFVMFLALSSHDVLMGPIVRSMGMVAKHLHKRGEPIVLATSPARPVASKHYASLARARRSDETAVPAWLDQTVRRINDQPALVSMIRAGAVEAMAWIAVMPHDPTPAPLRVDKHLVDVATRLGTGILIEDTNREDPDGSPENAWLG